MCRSLGGVAGIAHARSGRDADATRVLRWLDFCAARLPCREAPIAAAFGRAELVACQITWAQEPFPPRLYPGVLLFPLAVLVAVTQGSKLARSMDVTDGARLRRKRLKASAALAGSLPVIYLVSLPVLGDDWKTDAVVAFGVWFAVLITAARYFVAGISTPKSTAATH